jgi:hypothetical protein
MIDSSRITRLVSEAAAKNRLCESRLPGAVTDDGSNVLVDSDTT